MEIHLPHTHLAERMLNATPNLFGAIKCRKVLDIPKKNTETLNAQFGGSIVKEWDIVNIATFKDYGVAVNNKREASEQERDFTPQPRKWGRYVDGSHIVVENKGFFYLAFRLNRNSKVTVRYFDGNGNARTYEEVECVLGSGDKRSTKERSRQASAEKQGLSLEDSVKPMDTRTDHIVELAYGGDRYIVVPATDGGQSAENAPATTPAPVNA